MRFKHFVMLERNLKVTALPLTLEIISSKLKYQHINQHRQSDQSESRIQPRSAIKVLNLSKESLPVTTVPTKLAQIKAEVGSFNHCHVLTGVPDVEVHKHWQRGEGHHAQPGQHEDIGQHDELRQTQTK